MLIVSAVMKTRSYHYMFNLIILLSDRLLTGHKIIFRNYNTIVHLVTYLKIRGLGFEGWLGVQSEVLQFALAGDLIILVSDWLGGFSRLKFES